MMVHINEDGVQQGINPFDHGSAYTDIMKTQALKQALNKYGFTAAFGGGRRDEEKSRAKERIFSFRNEAHSWDPKNQRPELWDLYNTQIKKGESIRVFPLSNWTEKDIWQYILQEQIEIVPLYFAKMRPVVYRDGNIIMVDDDRLKLREGYHTMILDGDNVRLGLNRDLGFEERDRIENIRRVAEVAKLMNDAGLIVLVSFISPYERDRMKAKEIIGDAFAEVYISTPLEECERRDVKGLYKKARAGLIPNFTGISSPYETPAESDLQIDTQTTSIEQAVALLLNHFFKEN